MTVNEFKICSILFFKKFEGKQLEDVFPQYSNIFTCGEICDIKFSSGGDIALTGNNNRLLYLYGYNMYVDQYYHDPRPTIMWNNVEDFLKFFKFKFEDVV